MDAVGCQSWEERTVGGKCVRMAGLTDEQVSFIAAQERCVAAIPPGLPRDQMKRRWDRCSDQSYVSSGMAVADAKARQVQLERRMADCRKEHGGIPLIVADMPESEPHFSCFIRTRVDDSNPAKLVLEGRLVLHYDMAK